MDMRCPRLKTQDVCTVCGGSRANRWNQKRVQFAPFELSFCEGVGNAVAVEACRVLSSCRAVELSRVCQGCRGLTLEWLHLMGWLYLGSIYQGRCPLTSVAIKGVHIGSSMPCTVRPPTGDHTLVEASLAQ